jgi:tripartite-type tricarboxylate transporter receptor subunit TctC
VNTALASASAKEKLGSLGHDLVGGSSEQFTKLVKSEIAKWAGVVKRTGAKVD